MVNIRKLLTEVLLTVTTEEMRGIAQEMYNEALKGMLLFKFGFISIVLLTRCTTVRYFHEKMLLTLSN